jgi:hypothetical protein
VKLTPAALAKAIGFGRRRQTAKTAPDGTLSTKSGSHATRPWRKTDSKHRSRSFLQKSLERNPTHGSAELLLVAALSLTGRHSEAVSMADSFREQYLESPASAFEQFWLSRSASPIYHAQVYPLFESVRALGAA